MPSAATVPPVPTAPPHFVAWHPQTAGHLRAQRPQGSFGRGSAGDLRHQLAAQEPRSEHGRAEGRSLKSLISGRSSRMFFQNPIVSHYPLGPQAVSHLELELIGSQVKLAVSMRQIGRKMMLFLVQILWPSMTSNHPSSYQQAYAGLRRHLFRSSKFHR